MNSGRRPALLAALTMLALMFARPAPAQAQHSMAGMNHITIPEGAIYTVADVEFMQG